MRATFSGQAIAAQSDYAETARAGSWFLGWPYIGAVLSVCAKRTHAQTRAAAEAPKEEDEKGRGGKSEATLGDEVLPVSRTLNFGTDQARMLLGRFVPRGGLPAPCSA